jgi:hypothetical protein
VTQAQQLPHLMEQFRVCLTQLPPIKSPSCRRLLNAGPTKASGLDVKNLFFS